MSRNNFPTFFICFDANLLQKPLPSQNKIKQSKAKQKQTKPSFVGVLKMTAQNSLNMLNLSDLLAEQPQTSFILENIILWRQKIHSLFHYNYSENIIDKSNQNNYFLWEGRGICSFCNVAGSTVCKILACSL